MMNDCSSTDSTEEENAIKLKNEILEWVQHEGMKGNIDDKMIFKFLDGCKYRVETVKKKMKNYYQIRQTTPEWFTNRDPFLKDIQGLLTLGIYLPLPDKDELGRLTLLVRPAMYNPSEYCIDSIYKISFMVFDLVIDMDDSMTKNGVHALVDLSGVSLGHILQTTPKMIKKTVQAWQNAYPVRFKSMTFYNCPVIATFTLNLMKYFMGSKLRKRVKIYSGNMQIYNDTDTFHLPVDFGGTNGCLAAVIPDWKERMETKRQWFLEQEQT